MASGKPDVMLLLLNKLLDDGNVLYKVGQLVIFLAVHCIGVPHEWVDGLRKDVVQWMMFSDWCLCFMHTVYWFLFTAATLFGDGKRT